MDLKVFAEVLRVYLLSHPDDERIKEMVRILEEQDD